MATRLQAAARRWRRQLSDVLYRRGASSWRVRRVCNPENLMQDTCQLGMPTGAITLHRVFGVGGRAQARSMVHDLRQCMRASLPKSRWAHRHGNPENTMQGGSRLCAASEGLASGFRPCGTILSVWERERGVVCVDVMDVFER